MVVHFITSVHQYRQRPGLHFQPIKKASGPALIAHEIHPLQALTEIHEDDVNQHII